MDQFGFARKLAAHPAYDVFWQAQALDKILATRPHKVDAMFVQGQWDQEDIYGAAAVWEATRKLPGADGDRLVIGPWRHGQADGDGSTLGPLSFDGDTAAYFRRYILQPFLDAHLVDGAPPAEIAPVSALRDRNQRLARLSELARARRDRPADLSSARREPRLRAGRHSDGFTLRQLRLRPRQARALPPAADPADLFDRLDLADMAGGRPARLLRPHRRAGPSRPRR